MNTNNVEQLKNKLQKTEEACAVLRAELEAEKTKKPRRRCGDVFTHRILRSTRIRDGEGKYWLYNGCESVASDSSGENEIGEVSFNVFDLAEALPEGIPDPSELVRKSDVVAALRNARSKHTGRNIFEQADLEDGSLAVIPQAVYALRKLGIVPQEKAEKSS